MESCDFVRSSEDGRHISFVDGITLGDLRVTPSDDGGHLLIHCREQLIAMLGCMGGSPESFAFADGRRYSAEELIGML